MDLALEGWRQAILDKNAENVVSLDRVFTLLPGRYGPQLEKLSQEDGDERVRAFSLRTLGKMKNVEMAGLYKKLLADDKSPFVRQNAAWALGELFTVPRGRAAIEGATGELRHAEGSDPAPDVRAAATKTLQKLQ
jgi:vesicle coat complex subunit